MIKKKYTVSLVLGSGGARGLAHIGIIEWLNDPYSSDVVQSVQSNPSSQSRASRPPNPVISTTLYRSEATL